MQLFRPVGLKELADFNAHIVGKIQVIQHFTGEKFTGEIDDSTHLPTYLNQRI